MDKLNVELVIENLLDSMNPDLPRFAKKEMQSQAAQLMQWCVDMAGRVQQFGETNGVE